MRSFEELAELTAHKYKKIGRFNHGFVRGKLKYDPMYQAIMGSGILADQKRILDIGCGRGILLSLLVQEYQSPKPTLFGIELRPNDAKTAQTVLTGFAKIVSGDVRKLLLPEVDAVILLDVLLYLQAQEQIDLLAKITDSLSMNGLILIREADANNGLRFKLTTWTEKFCAFSRGHWHQTYQYRSKQAWQDLLEAMNFKVTTLPMSRGTPFDNILFIARRVNSD